MSSETDRRGPPEGAFGGAAAAMHEDNGKHVLGYAEEDELLPDAREPVPSGTFPSRTANSDEAPFAALAPFYEEREVEHAILDIPDPIIGEPSAMAGSSLIPPPAKPFPLGRVVAVVAVLALGVGAGVYFQLQTQGSPAVTPESSALPVVAVGEMPAPVQAPVEVVPAPAEVAGDAVPAPVVETAVVSTPTEEPVMDEARARRHARREAKRLAAEAELTTGAAPVAATTDQPAVEAPSKQAAAAPEAAPLDLASLTLPSAPTRAQITASFNAILPQMRDCAAGKTGVAKAKVTIAGSGVVRHAVVGGDFRGTPAGSCMARVLRTATFVEFARTTMKVEYPFSL